MTIEIRYENDGKKKITFDTYNPRIYMEEWKCAGCGGWVHEDEVIWAKDDGTLTVMHPESKPWCDVCLPPEPEEA